MPLTESELRNRFRFHPAGPERGAQHQVVRDAMAKAAEVVVSYVPPGREQALALTKLEEAMMWANAGIARQPPDPTA